MKIARLTSIALAASAALIATIGSAKDHSNSFTANGVTYVYTSTEIGSRTVIEGQTYPAHDAFHLVVRDDRVTGQVAGRPVSFKVQDTHSGGVALAAR